MANSVLGKSLRSDWFFLGQDFAYGPFSWKRSNPCILLWSEAGKFKISNQNSEKKNCEYCHSSQWNYQKKLKRLKFEEDEHSHCEFYYPEDLETFDVETETGITECHIINNLLTELTNRACSGRTGEYSPVRPSRSVSKRLIVLLPTAKTTVTAAATTARYRCGCYCYCCC